MDEEKIKKIKERKAWSDRRLKGSMAECIVEQMLRDSGHQVYRFGYEMVLQHLKEVKLKDNYVKRLISSMPDFIIVNKNGYPDFIEVKYRKDGKLNKDKRRIEILGEGWGKGRIIVVSNEEPYFQISRIENFLKTGKLYQLEKDKFIKVNKGIIKRYTYLVKKYFEGK